MTEEQLENIKDDIGCATILIIFILSVCTVAIIKTLKVAISAPCQKVEQSK